MLDSEDISVIKKGLLLFTYLDATNVIINYINSPLEQKEIEDIEFLNECVKRGDYFYYTNKGIRLNMLNYLSMGNKKKILELSNYCNVKYVGYDILLETVWKNPVFIFNKYFTKKNCDIAYLLSKIYKYLLKDRFFTDKIFDQYVYIFNMITGDPTYDINQYINVLIPSYRTIKLLKYIKKLDIKYLYNSKNLENICNTEYLEDILLNIYNYNPDEFKIKYFLKDYCPKYSNLNKLCKQNYIKTISKIKGLSIKHLIDNSCLEYILSRKIFVRLDNLINLTIPYKNIYKIDKLLNGRYKDTVIYHLINMKHKITLSKKYFQKLFKDELLCIVEHITLLNNNNQLLEDILEVIDITKQKNNTIIYNICCNMSYRQIRLLKNCNINQFQNRNYSGNYYETELHHLCKSKNGYGSTIIRHIIKSMNYKLTSTKYFLNKNYNNETELDLLCRYDSSILLYILGILKKNNVYFDVTDFTNTALYCLCKYNELRMVFKYIKNINIKHFLYKSEEGYNSLYWLFKNCNFKIAKQIPGLLQYRGETEVERNYIQFLRGPII